MNYFKQINESFNRLQENVLKDESLKEGIKDNTTYQAAIKKYLKKFEGKSKHEVEKIVSKSNGNPAADEAYKKWLKKNESLDEALPKDLMKQIRRADNVNFNRRRNDFNDGRGELYGPTYGIINDRRWNSDTQEWKDNYITGIKDFANATYREVTPDEVRAMKKAGQDLSGVYIINKPRNSWNSAEMIRLDSEGHPYKYGSTDDTVRANQSLNKSLENADKIYVTDIKDFLDSQPEKAHARLDNRKRRKANLGLGHERPSYSDETRGGSSYIKYKKRQGENKAAIDAIKAQYDAGDISRKEMERQIANINAYSTPSDWDIEKYNKIRDTNAANRYLDSKASLQKPFDDLKQYRDEIDNAKRYLSKNRQELNAIKNGTADQSTGDLYDYNYNKVELENRQKELLKLQKQIESTQKEIDRLSKLVTSDAKQAEIDKYQKNIDDTISKINSAQNNIDKLLRRK